jgi:hypothetical protein
MKWYAKFGVFGIKLQVQFYGIIHISQSDHWIRLKKFTLTTKMEIFMLRN